MPICSKSDSEKVCSNGGVLTFHPVKSCKLNMMRMMMKMAAVSTITRLLLFCSVIASTDSEVCTHHAATDGNFTVILARPLDGSEKLRWMHGTSIILDRRPNNVFLKGSEKDVHKNGSLKLTNLKKNDAGEYKPEVFSKDGKSVTNLKSIHLCILDPVLKPTVKNECLAEPKVKFICTAGQPAKDLKFEWLQNGKVLPDKKGPTLQEDAVKVEKDLFSCKVSNLVSSKTSVAVKQSCFESKSFLFEEFFGINIWIIVGGGGGVVLLLIIIIIFCCIRTRRKKSMQIKDEEELRLGWTNPEQQRQHHQHSHPPDQHHHHHHHHQQQPAGHTGPRQHRSKQHREQQRPRAPDHPNGQPQPSPRRPAQAPRPVDKVDDEQPPPLPQPRKKAPKTPRA